MKLLVDADACPVKDIIVRLAKANQLEVEMYFDTSHQYEDGYSKTFQFDKGADSVDYAIVNATSPGDVVITQDYGLASMVLSRNAKAIHPNGRIFHPDNILGLLTRRAIHKKQRHKHTKGPKKRISADDERFARVLESLIKKI